MFCVLKMQQNLDQNTQPNRRFRGGVAAPMQWNNFISFFIPKLRAATDSYVILCTFFVWEGC